MDVIIALGGNVGDVSCSFRKAVQSLDESAGVAVQERSTVFRTGAVGPPQPDYLNAAILVRVKIPPVELLELCQDLERAAGRDRRTEERWGPRPLDLDLLIADGVVCRGPRLELPHPRLCERAFSLIPAAELAPDWVHPVSGRTLKELANEMTVNDKWKVITAFEW